MTEEQKIVLELIGQTLFNVPFDPDKYKQIDWQAVYNESHRQTVVPTIIESVPRDADENLRYRWIEDAYNFQKRGYEVLLAHKNVSGILKNEGIPHAVIKGASSGSYYPRSYMRNYGDVDLLIHPDDIERLKDVLLTNGYEIGKELPFEFSMNKDNVNVDIHLEVNGIPFGTCGEYIRSEMGDLIQSSITCDACGFEIPVPNDIHHGFIQLMHTAKHMVGFGAGLRQLCDWAAYINKMGEDFPEFLEDKLKKAGLWRFSIVMSAACVKYMHMPGLSWIEDTDSDIIDRFMEDIMRKGGIHHTGDDDMDSVFIEETNKGGVSGNGMFGAMLKNITGKVCYQWPVMKKHRILIPFGFAWMSVRYVAAVIKGEYKSTNIRETVTRANKRKELYNDLGLFMEAKDETDK